MWISPKVERVLVAEQIQPAELDYMVQHAAITSLRRCNRRYFHWVFLLVGENLQDMQYADVVMDGRGENRMLEDHQVCDGKGCRSCGWVGQISRAIVDTTAEEIAKVEASHRW